MHFHEKDIYHIYNRGNNSQQIFFERENYLYFLRLTKKFLSPAGEILAWCLMPNHFHFMIYANEISTKTLENRNFPIQRLSESLRLLLSSYTKAINYRYHRNGNLFQQKTKSKNLYDGEDNYVEQAFHYIHNNPVKATLCNKPAEWEFSSYRDYEGLRNGTLCNKVLVLQLLNLEMENFEAYSNSFLGDVDERKIL